MVASSDTNNDGQHRNSKHPNTQIPKPLTGHANPKPSTLSNSTVLIPRHSVPPSIHHPHLQTHQHQNNNMGCIPSTLSKKHKNPTRQNFLSDRALQERKAHEAALNRHRDWSVRSECSLSSPNHIGVQLLWRAMALF